MNIEKKPIKNILIYGPYNARARDIESTVLALKNEGHNVHFYSQAEGKDIAEFFSKNGIKTYTTLKQQGLLKKILSLITYCRKHKIDILFSHLEPANFVSVLAQYFIRAKVFICRHHIDEIHLNNQDKLLSYQLTYKLGKNFIVVSKKAKDFMVNVEKVDSKKIHVINLGYDFNLYGTVNTNEVASIRNEYKANLLLITACRLVKDKRPELSIQVTEELVKKGISVKLLLLGDGELIQDLRNLVKKKNLENHCFILGKKKNILDYLSAADILIHPSIIDSSSVIVKEAGLVKKPVVVCREVGDFIEYIVSHKNGILVSKDNFVEDTVQNLLDFNAKKESSDMGKSLYNDVYRLFSIENVFPFYQKLINNV